LKAKGSKPVTALVYKPIDESTYPVELVDGDNVYWRIWCRPETIVYEKYKNGVRLTYLVLPEEKEIFNLNSLITYVENKKTTGQVLCRT
jgi:hypothetical protein